LAIPDLPLAYGKVFPPASNAALTAINDQRVYQHNLDRVSLGQVWLHFGHRIGAILASLAIVTLIIKVIRQHDGRKLLLQPAVILSLLLVTQITLGVYTVLKRKPADVASAHVAVGATVLVFCFMLAVRSMRLYSRRFRQRTESVQVNVNSIGPKGFLVS
jgi:cytochrome c oxidase assembly protein subunit 15